MEELCSGDDIRIENQLGEFTTMLCIGDEDYIRNFDIWSFIPIFLDFLSDVRESKQVKVSGKLEIMIMSARAIGLILNIVPQSCPVVISSGAVPVLVSLLGNKKLNGELAEDVLKCLDKISVENPNVLFQEKTFMITLVNSIERLRNFSNGLVKPALSLIANLYRKLTPNEFGTVSKSFAVLSQLFSGTEEEVEKVCECFAYLLERFADEPKRLKEISDSGLVANAVARLGRASTSKTSLLRLLSKLCQAYPEISGSLIKEGIFKHLQSSLSPQHSVFNAESSLSALISSDIGLIDTLYLLLSVLPPLYGQDILSITSVPESKWFWEDDFHNFTEYDAIASAQMEGAFIKKEKLVTVKIVGKAYEIDLTKMQQYNKSSKLMRNVTRTPIPTGYKRNSTINTDDTKEKSFSSFFKKQKSQYPQIYSNSVAKEYEKSGEVVGQLFQYLVDPLVEICSSTASISIQQDASMALGRIFYLATEESLAGLNRNRMVGFLTKIFGSSKRDSVVLTHGLLICEVLMTRTKLNYEKLLSREGFYPLVKGCISGKSPEAIATERFLSVNFTKVKEEITEEEKLLSVFCKNLLKGDIDLTQLIELFKTDQISKFQFMKLGFPDALNQYLAKETRVRASKLIQVFQRSPDTLKKIVNMLNFSLESLEQLEAVTNTVIQPFSEEKDGYILSQAIPIVIKSKDKKLDLSATPHSMEPLATIGTLKQHIFKKIGIQVDVFLGDSLLNSYQTLLEVATVYNKIKFAALPSSSITFLISKPTPRLDLTFPEDIFVTRLKNAGVAEQHPSNPYLTCLRALYHINRYWRLYTDDKIVSTHPIIPVSEFINYSISSKVQFQLQTKDSLFLCAMGLFPAWIDLLIESCRFLLSFELRRLLFYVVNFGATKSLSGKHSSYGGSAGTKIGRKNVNRITVKRDTLLKDAITLFSEESTTKSTIEIEYEGERGFGSGPSLAFYSLLSQDVQKKSHGLFLDFSDQDRASDYVTSPNGLFPAPLPLSEKKNIVLNMWKFLGQLVGKALEDNRILDTQFTNSFVKLCQGEKLKLDDFKEIDVFLHNHLKFINELKEQKAGKHNEKNLRDTISNLYLDWTYKGNDIVPKGSEKEVTYDNIEQYLKEFQDYATNKCINLQMQSFLQELSNILPLHRLRYFTQQELVSLISGNDEKWDKDLLQQSIILEGYFPNDKNLKNFVEILSELSPDEKKRFIEFSTGSSRLPIGGIKNLNPKLSIIKLPQREGKPDSQLPMANTCFHYFKLPEYTSKEVMKDRLKTAINNAGGFELT